MPRPDLRTCRQCNRHANVCGPLSHTRLCADCGLFNQTRAIIEIAEGAGDIAQRRLRRTIMVAHAQLLAMQDENA